MRLLQQTQVSFGDDRESACLSLTLAVIKELIEFLSSQAVNTTQRNRFTIIMKYTGRYP
jgi:hypothetical protein